MATPRRQEQAMDEQPLAPPQKLRGRPRRPQRLNVCTSSPCGCRTSLLHRLDAYTAQAQAAQPYQRLSRADVLRRLLDQGLRTASGQAQESTAG